jgi:3-hydroxyisobutyrate dehydrogenase-like beta-hydroxyacid dehydrogenase
MSRKQIAMYGLGNMGYLVAERLAQQFSVMVADLDEAQLKRAETELSATVIRQPQDVAQAEAVVLCLPSPAASRAVLAQIGPHLAKNTVIIETSTVNPADVQACERSVSAQGARIIDASILAGVSQMQAGTATLLLGGDEAAIEACRPVLNAIAPKQIHFGPVGAGAAAKVINNAVAHAVMIVVAEAGSMATAAGVSCEKLVALLSDAQMGLHRPLTHRYAERVVQGNYEGGMPLDAARKDSTLALELAQSLGVPLFAIQASHTVYEIATAAGYGRDDYAAIARLWADWGRPAVPN